MRHSKRNVGAQTADSTCIVKIVPVWLQMGTKTTRKWVTGHLCSFRPLFWICVYPFTENAREMGFLKKWMSLIDQGNFKTAFKLLHDSY